MSQAYFKQFGKVSNVVNNVINSEPFQTIGPVAVDTGVALGSMALKTGISLVKTLIGFNHDETPASERYGTDTIRSHITKLVAYHNLTRNSILSVQSLMDGPYSRLVNQGTDILNELREDHAFLREMMLKCALPDRKGTLITSVGTVSLPSGSSRVLAQDERSRVNSITHGFTAFGSNSYDYRKSMWLKQSPKTNPFEWRSDERKFSRSVGSLLKLYREKAVPGPLFCSQTRFTMRVDCVGSFSNVTGWDETDYHTGVKMETDGLKWTQYSFEKGLKLSDGMPRAWNSDGSVVPSFVDLQGIMLIPTPTGIRKFDFSKQLDSKDKEQAIRIPYGLVDLRDLPRKDKGEMAYVFDGSLHVSLTRAKDVYYTGVVFAHYVNAMDSLGNYVLVPVAGGFTPLGLTLNDGTMVGNLTSDVDHGFSINIPASATYILSVAVPVLTPNSKLSSTTFRGAHYSGSVAGRRQYLVPSRVSYLVSNDDGQEKYDNIDDSSLWSDLFGTCVMPSARSRVSTMVDGVWNDVYPSLQRAVNTIENVLEEKNTLFGSMLPSETVGVTNLGRWYNHVFNKTNGDNLMNVGLWLYVDGPFKDLSRMAKRDVMRWIVSLGVACLDLAKSSNQ